MHGVDFVIKTRRIIIVFIIVVRIGGVAVVTPIIVAPAHFFSDGVDAIAVALRGLVEGQVTANHAVLFA